MLIYIIYFIIFLILSFVLVIAVKAITRGIEAKEKNKEEEFLYNHKKEDSADITSKIEKLNKLHVEGILNDDEFKKAKEKLLK